jgi:Tyrosine phosphatase family
LIKRFFRINDNLYRGSAPSPQDVIALKNQYGIKKIVSLDEIAGKHIGRICKLLDLTHIIIPLNADDIEPMANLLNENLQQLLIEGGPTYVHCIQGKDRTGMVIAMYDCKYNDVSCDEAIDRAKSLGFGIGLPPTIRDFYERAIRSYCDCEMPEDENSADIVDHTRQWRNEWRGSVLDEADRKSFSTYQDPNVNEWPELSDTYTDTLNGNFGIGETVSLRSSPFGQPYDYAYDPKWSTRETNEEPADFEDDYGVPMVGQYDSDAGIKGVGPVEIGGGFVNS